MKTEVLQNLINIDAKINEVCKAIGRDREDIIVSLATKTQTIEDIKLALSAGVATSCGENRVQEFMDKYTPEITWDFIGQLQTNKVKYIVGKVNLIHSVDREELLYEIEKEAKKRNLTVNVLIEVNVGREPQKGGVYPEKLGELIEYALSMPHIKIKGLMTVAPKVDDPSPFFDELVKLYDIYKKLCPDFQYISAGMSKDYLTAIKCGSNLIRLGSVVFGEREPAYGEKNC